MRKTKRLGRLFGGLLAAVLVLAAASQSPTWAAEAGDSKEEDKVKVIIHTELPDAEVGVFQLEKKVAVIEPAQGYVEVLTKDSRLTAAKLVYSQSDETGELSGNVTVAREDLDAEADHMLADFAQETYTLEGNVYLRQWDTEEEGKLKLEVWSDWMHVQEDGKRLHARGNVRVVEPERKAWADELEYDDEQEVAVLTGNVRLETDDGSVLTGTKVVINLSTDEATVYGPTYAEFILGRDE